MFNPSTSERRWVINFTLLVVLFTSLPYLIGFYWQDEIWRFSGFIFGVEDGNSYIAKMLSGAAGSWLFRSPYSVLPQRGFLAFYPYLLLGKLTAPPGHHEQLIGLFQLFRIFGCWAMIAATYDFISIFISDISYKRWAVILATLGGGLGWLSILGLSGVWQNNLPLEFYSPETFGFLSLYGLPHLAFGRALLLWGFCSFLNESKQTRSIYLPGVLWTLSGLFQPINILIGWCVLGVYLILRFVKTIMSISNKEIKWTGEIKWFHQAAISVIISSPLVAYNIFSFSFDPYLRLWAEQNLVLSPPIKDYLLAYGLLIPGIIAGTLAILKESNTKKLLIVGWVIALPLLVNLPINLQRRLAEGSWVALCILVCSALSQMNRRWQVFHKILFCSSLISVFILISGGIFTVTIRGYPIYNRVSEIEAFNYLARTAKPNDAVLATYAISNALPAWAPVRVIAGHGSESARVKIMNELIAASIKRDPNYEVINQLVSDYKLSYIIDCNLEGQGMDAKKLTSIYKNNECEIYDLQYYRP